MIPDRKTDIYREIKSTKNGNRVSFSFSVFFKCLKPYILICSYSDENLGHLQYFPNSQAMVINFLTFACVSLQDLPSTYTFWKIKIRRELLDDKTSLPKTYIFNRETLDTFLLMLGKRQE